MALVPTGAAAATADAPPPEAIPSYDQQLTAALGRMKKMYLDHIRPLEQAFEYDVLKPSWFGDTITQKKPCVTFLGGFSTGKSTAINYLLGQNILGVGPQPLTDKFTAIFHGDETKWIPGRALIANANEPWRGLAVFGDGFAEFFAGLQCNHEILRSVSIVDTPGVLESAEGAHSRRYDYVKACRWFCERSDLIFFMFDPSKLDSGTEMRMLFRHGVRGLEGRVRIILNKADTVGPQELMRVYGALFWNLSTLIDSTEPPRVFVTSLWDKPYKPGTNERLFAEEKADLFYDLIEVVPLQSLDKRVTHVIRRAQDVLLHTLVCATLRQGMPMLFGKDKAKAQAIANLPSTCQMLADKHHLSVKDFASQQQYAQFFEKVNLFDMKNMDDIGKLNWITNIKSLINEQLPALLDPIKTAPVVDPRDKRHQIMVSREYQSKMEAQLAGQSGIQGALGEMAANANRPVQVPGAMTPQQMMMMMQMMQGGMAPAPAPVPVAPPAAAPQMTPEMMQQMMAMMAAQQRQ